MRQKHILLAVMGVVVALVITAILLGLWQERQLQQTYTTATQPQEEVTIPQEPPVVEDTPQEENATAESPALDVLQESQQEAAEEPLPQVGAEPPEVPTTQLTVEQEAERVTEEAIAQLYQAQADYQAKLDGVVDATVAAFLALPLEEQTQENKMALVDAQYDLISAMERECDAQVEALIQVIAKAQMTLGDHNLVNEIRSHYAESKATWKADCLTALATS